MSTEIAPKPASIDLDTGAKAIAVIAVVLPMSAVFTRWLAITLRFSQAPVNLAVGESIGELTAQGFFITFLAFFLAGMGYYISRSPNTISPASTYWRVMRWVIAAEFVLVTAVVIWTAFAAGGFPGTSIRTISSPLLGAWVGRHARRGPLSLRDLLPVIVMSALISSVGSGLSGSFDTISGDFVFTPGTQVPNASYVEVATTGDGLLYLTPCTGGSSLVAIRLDEISRTTFRPTISSASLRDILTKGQAVSIGYPNRC